MRDDKMADCGPDRETFDLLLIYLGLQSHDSVTSVVRELEFAKFKDWFRFRAQRQCGIAKTTRKRNEGAYRVG